MFLAFGVFMTMVPPGATNVKSRLVKAIGSFTCSITLSEKTQSYLTSVPSSSVKMNSSVSPNCSLVNFFAGGVSFVDFNGDGRDDLTFATNSGEPMRFFQGTQTGLFEWLPNV